MIVKNCTLIKPVSCEQDTSVVDVAKQLREAKQRRIIITENGKPVGIISTTDMNNKVVAEGKDASALTAKDIMSDLLVVGDLEDHLNEMYNKMVEHTSFFVPVTKEGKLYGVLTYGELSRRIGECLDA